MRWFWLALAAVSGAFAGFWAGAFVGSALWSAAAPTVKNLGDAFEGIVYGLFGGGIGALAGGALAWQGARALMRQRPDDPPVA